MRVIYKPNKIDTDEPGAAEKSRERLAGQTFDLPALKKVLESYNKTINNPIEIDTSHPFVVTGQQLGLMGGPLYTVLKGISCLQAAKEHGATPLFWLATEDHDIGEIDHTYLLDEMGNLEKYKIPLPKRGLFVEDLQISANGQKVIDRFLEKTGGELQRYDSYSRQMACWMSKLFAGTGMVFLEPWILRSMAAPFFQKELREGQAGRLFYKDETGRRKKISTVDQKILDLPPTRLSTGVLARAVLQSVLIPTLAYIAGPAELSYWKDLGEYHRFHGAAMPWLVPRISATLIPGFAEEMLQRVGKNPWDEIVLDESSKEGHTLRNLLYPRQKLQERVLNFSYFQTTVETLSSALDWKSRGHAYCFLGQR